MTDGDTDGSGAVWDRLQALPSIHEEPLVWDHTAGGFVPAAAPPAVPRSGGAPPPQAAGARRHVVINAGEVATASPGAAARPAGAAPPAPPRPPTARPAERPAPRPAPKPAPAARPAKVRPKGRRRRRVLLALVLVPLALLGALFAFGWWKFSQIPRVDVASVLSPRAGAGQNFLIVGTDSREGIDPNDPNAQAFIGEAVSGSRTDSIMVMHIEGDQQVLLSIPRDLWVKDPATGQMGRINATFTAGPANLIRAVQNLGIPVHHYVEINFVSFGKLVDAVGGIDVDFPAAARDESSGLYVETPGVNHLDGAQALAYVRARHYEELKANPKNPAQPIWVTDPRSDLGRVERQRAFLTALMNKVTDTRNPVTLSSITSAMSVGLKLDNAMNFLDAIRLAWTLKGFHPESVSLPVTPRTTSGGADVLDLKTKEAAPIIGQFNG